VQTGELERQRLGVEQSFRNAMMQHYNQMEERQQGFYNKMQQEDQERGVLGEQNIAREQQQNALAEKQNILRVAMQLNATGQLTDKSRDGVNHWLSTDSDMSKSGIQLAPPPNASTDPGSIQTALAQGIALREKYQSIADTTKDPAQKANALKVIGIIDANLGGKGAPQRQDETDTETAGTDTAGNATKTITKHFGEMPQRQRLAVDNASNTVGRWCPAAQIKMVGTARCAVRAACLASGATTGATEGHSPSQTSRPSRETPLKS
jgi:hypothetical protein